MFETTNNGLQVRCPDVHARASTRISFVRTLRIPDDNHEYPLPAGLGHFPLHHIDDFARKVPERWVTHGGVFMPMYQSEAMWLKFSGDYPFAVKIAAGKINAVTGEPWRDGLSDSPQDYVVVPGQPWLDGFCVSKGLIRQFVAMRLGEGYTAEEQITGEAEHGGLQIVAYPMRRELYEAMRRPRFLARARYAPDSWCSGDEYDALSLSGEMGMAPGGTMRQEIFKDRHGLSAWDQAAGSRCFVHIVNSEGYHEITGCRPPHEPMTARDYRRNNIPWFDYYDADQTALAGAKVLRELDSVSTRRIKQGQRPVKSCVDLDPADVRTLGPNTVRDGHF